MSTGTLVDVVMPQMGVSVSEGTISRWAKQAGESIAADETIAEISTDKVDTEIPAPATGTVKELLVGEGETVPVGTRIAVIDTGGGGGGDASAAPAAQTAAAGDRSVPDEAPGTVPETPADAATGDVLEPSGDRPHFQEMPIAAAPAPAAAESVEAPAAANGDGDGEARTFMSPVVARMVAEHHLDIGRIPGSGRGGRVTKKDVERFLASGAPAAEPAAAAAAPPAAPAAPAPPSAPSAAPAPAPVSPLTGGEESSPLSSIRKVIARNMRNSVDTAAHVTSISEVDMTRVVNLRKQLNPHYQTNYGVKLSFMPFIMRAVIEAIPHWPWVNAEIRGDQVVVKKYVNLGVAVAIDDSKGLVVPVIHNAEEKNMLGLSRSLIDLAERARARKLVPDEMAGGTFTITNPGVFGALMGTPIIPMPQVAIIDVEAIVKRPVVVTDEYGNDSIAIRHMMYLPISYDHRLVDGAYAAQFMQLVKRHLETWGEAEYGA